MRNKIETISTWFFFALTSAAFIAPGITAFITRPGGKYPGWEQIVFPLVPVCFGFFGALIISRQPGNRIGMLMMLPSVSLFPLIDAFLAPYIQGYAPLPRPAPLYFLVILWFSNWDWGLLVFPLMFMMLLFPTGRPFSPRWKWLVYAGIGLAAVLPVLSMLSRSLAPGSGNVDWSYPNPLGFMDPAWSNQVVLPPIMAAFLVWIVLCVVSLFLRFRHAHAIEKEQIKWLFFAAAIFAICYIPVFVGNAFGHTESFGNILFAIGLFAFPVAIGIAILRYRLYDIELIIRRTLVYSLVTGLLALVYFGGVTLLQSLFTSLSGEQSPAAVVISTLLIAALFNPLRRRIQEFIDRRFYRQKYNAEQALAEFAAAASRETDLKTLTNQLTATVEQTLQPVQSSLWFKADQKPNERKRE